MEDQKINLNDTCTVRLTDFGREVLEENYKKYFTPEDVEEIIGHKQDDLGNTKLQLWELFQIFGPEIHLGMNEVPFENNIITLKNSI